MGIREKAKDLAAIIGASAILFGAANGIGTLIPNKYDPFGGVYNRPCAAFRTNNVRKIALEEQGKIFDRIYREVKDAIYKR
ncbi:hypothetical protein D6825_00900 [Candidatus Woesearchaeota archaeon]|nr:MAG: hypothetical protein D6825_00900 [Candidatus Woesearchaeota archaeon]